MAQALPQAPQFLPSTRMLVSQPLPAKPSQSAKPGLQAMLHAPELHAAVPFVLLQTLPQAPQLLGVLRLVSQPLLARPSQLPKPGLQAILHAPELHPAVALVRMPTFAPAHQVLGA